MDGTNIVIVGKSGIGKSTLLNYVFDKDVAKTGTGKPVTEQGFHFFSDIVEGKKINIFDSWGIEAGKTDIWLNDLNRFLENRKSLNIGNWIHTVIFCLSAEGKRVEDFEKGIFKLLKEEFLNPIIVITKSDLDIHKSFLNAVNGEFENEQIIEICSVSKKVGLGLNKKESEKSGKSNLIEVIKKNSAKSFKNRFKIVSQKYIAERKANKWPFFADKVGQIIDSYSNEFNFIGNIDEKTVKTILKKVDDLVDEYDKATYETIKNFEGLANNSFSNLYFFINNINTQKLNTEFDVNSSDFINSHHLFKKGQRAYLDSVLWGGPVGPIIMAYIRNRGISKKDLISRIEIEIKK